MSNKSAGESGDVTLRIQLARHIAAPVLNKGEVEKKKKKKQDQKKILKNWILFLVLFWSLQASNNDTHQFCCVCNCN